MNPLRFSGVYRLGTYRLLNQETGMAFPLGEHHSQGFTSPAHPFLTSLYTAAEVISSQTDLKTDVFLAINDANGDHAQRFHTEVRGEALKHFKNTTAKGAQKLLETLDLSKRLREAFLQQHAPVPLLTDVLVDAEGKVTSFQFTSQQSQHRFSLTPTKSFPLTFLSLAQAPSNPI